MDCSYIAVWLYWRESPSVALLVTLMSEPEAEARNEAATLRLQGADLP